VRVGATVYLSGQIPLDPNTGLVIEGDIEAQARRAFENLKAVCEAAGGSLTTSCGRGCSSPTSAISARSTR
jgi:enamine deaminase RidA (YjgF/YER057c/UK114 family)